MSVSAKDQGFWSHITRLFNPAKSVSLQTARAGETIGEIARLDPDATLARLNSRAKGFRPKKPPNGSSVMGKTLSQWRNTPASHPAPDYPILNPLNVMLLVLASINFFFLDDLESGSVVTVMIVLSVSLSFVQESRSNKAAAKLRAMVSNTASVMRQSLCRRPAERYRKRVPQIVARRNPGRRAGARRRYLAFRRRHDTGGYAHSFDARFVHQPVGADRRIPAGREIPYARPTPRIRISSNSAISLSWAAM